MNSPHPTRHFLGVRFWNGEPARLLVEADAAGGLFTCPSAPSLAEMRADGFLREAYQASDWAVVDGGYVALVLRLLFHRPIARISGLQLLQRLFGLDYPQALPFRERRILWVVPNQEERARISAFLESSGMDPGRQFYYQAPFYQTDASYEDAELVKMNRETAADWVILCIGGGRQEKLGLRLREALQSAGHQPGARPLGPVILCTGGAIAFLTGGQANIPWWADRLYLGWFLRIVQNPKVFLKRYWSAGWQFPRLLWAERSRLFDEGGKQETP
jgi:UDP-N-acetyl-D-mannosaminuronic acid transferase (WecB/TagA/CpsF family)